MIATPRAYAAQTWMWRPAGSKRGQPGSPVPAKSVIEGLFFYGAFAYVDFLRSRGLLHGLASGTNWVFRDESMHMAFAFDVVETVRREEPDLFDDKMAAQVTDMLTEAVENFFERRVSAYQVGVTGTVGFDDDF